jgi:hypothetical protein
MWRLSLAGDTAIYRGNGESKSDSCFCFRIFKRHLSAATEANRQVNTRRGERRSWLPHENTTALCRRSALSSYLGLLGSDREGVRMRTRRLSVGLTCARNAAVNKGQCFDVSACRAVTYALPHTLSDSHAREISSCLLGKSGGPDRDRTGDLLNAIQARSQLRYRP